MPIRSAFFYLKENNVCEKKIHEALQSLQTILKTFRSLSPPPAAPN